MGHLPVMKHGKQAHMAHVGRGVLAEAGVVTVRQTVAVKKE